jgi:endonuclease III related protein
VEDKKNRARRTAEINSAYEILLKANGHLDWWPGDSPLEIIVGAILTQNTAWTNVEKAIVQLKAEDLLSVRALRDVDDSTLEQAIRPSGYFRQKSRKLKGFVAWLDEAYGGRLANLKPVPTARLREELLTVWGIGPETADSILLYAFERPVFVVDAYTKRVATRHGWVGEAAGYETLQDCFTSSLPEYRDLYNDYHAQIVMVGKFFCGPKPKCENCPLKGLL